MNPSGSASQNLRRRERRAAESIMDNSALRDNLSDEQANQLLEWAFTHIEQVVKRTQSLPDDDAQPIIDHTIIAISRVMLQVNRLIDCLVNQTNLEESESYFALFINNLAALQTLSADVYDRLAMMVNLSDEGEVFDLFMQILRPAPDETQQDS